MKPIEPGCKAVVMNSFAGNEGKVVRVVSCFGEKFYAKFGRVVAWVVDADLKNTVGGYDNVVPGPQLRRIDDDSPKVVSWESMKGIWTPEGVTA